MAEYNVRVQLEPVIAGFSEKVRNALKNQAPIKIKLDVDSNSLSLAKAKLQNQLNSIRASHKDAYNNSVVGLMDDAVQKMVRTFDGSKVSAAKVQVGMGQLRNEVKETEQAIRTTTSSTDNLGTSIIKVVGKIAMWGIATTVLYGTLKKIKEGVQYVKDLDTEMTNIGMAMGQTTDQISNLSLEFNDMARELGVTTLEVARGATAWIRQGKSAAETMEFLRSSTMMSKLGNLEAADATDKLIAVTNAYNISAKDSIKVVDVLIDLDNRFATSTSEISAAMQKSASMSKLAGVSYQDLASYIAVISATTRQSGETIGQAMKTIFARMEQVKAGANIDQEGEAINNVEKVLLANGIALRDDVDSFRDMSAVLQDGAVKYKELAASGDTVAQQQIIGAIAGKLRMPERMVTYGQYNAYP